MSAVTGLKPSVESLSARQVRLLLRTIAEHKGHLDSAHADATRLARYGVRPSYLIDFDLLYMYMFEYEEHVDWAQEFQFLISNRKTCYILGPGTQTELVRLKERPGASRVTADDIAERLPELAELLRAPNVVAYEDLVGSMEVDDDAYEVALATLDRTRRARKEAANQADALNWAAVVYIRRHLREIPDSGFPYLLTGTEPLLREEAWDADFAVPISRGPGAAIYSQVLFEVFADPNEAMRHTVEAAFQIATVERELRTSPAYTDPDGHQREPDLESALAEGRIGAELRAQLTSLSAFVDDAVIYAVQRVYDNADLVAESLAQQHHRPRHGPGHESPRRLFDLIASLNAAMQFPNDSSSRRGLASLWRTVLRLDEVRDEEYMSYTLRDRGGRIGKPPYFAIEVHPSDDGADPIFVMRWPSGLDTTNLLHALEHSFQRHEETRVQLAVGTPDEVFLFDVAFPLLLDEIVTAVADAQGDSYAGGLGRGEFHWLRMNGQAFDLYADVATEMPHDPVVGVFAPALNAPHVTDLYQKSSARYLFGAWLQAALTHISEQAEHYSQHAHEL